MIDNKVFIIDYDPLNHKKYNSNSKEINNKNINIKFKYKYLIYIV